MRKKQQLEFCQEIRFFSLSLGLKQDQSCLARQPGAELSGSWCHFARNVIAVLGNTGVSNEFEYKVLAKAKP